MRGLPYTSRHVPAGYVPYPVPDDLAAAGVEVHTQTHDHSHGHVLAIVFCGKRMKPDWHYRFPSVANMETNIAHYLDSQRAALAARAARKAAPRVLSGSAQCAVAIRGVLALAFPTTKFSVISENFANGDAVRVDYTDGPTLESVKTMLSSYQLGHFDGMTDCYEYSNTHSDQPQTKYLSTTRHMSEAAEMNIVAMLNIGNGPPDHECWCHDASGDRYWERDAQVRRAFDVMDFSVAETPVLQPKEHTV